MPCQSNTPFSSLTLDDIETWIEGPTADEGRKLHDQGKVSDLALTEDGDLLTWVEDPKRHAVMVFFEDQILSSACTCGKPGTCEHAVAAAYEYLLLDSEEEALPVAGEDDERLSLLNDFNEDPSETEIFLDSLSKNELIDLILDLADEILEVDEELNNRAEEAFKEAGI